MKQVTLFCRLAGMRRRAGGSPIQSVTWAAGLVWRAKAKNRDGWDGLIMAGGPTLRAIDSYLRKAGSQQPASDLSGPATAGGLDYIVLRNLGGVLAVYRVLPVIKTLRRLKRWPKGVE